MRCAGKLPNKWIIYSINWNDDSPKNDCDCQMRTHWNDQISETFIYLRSFIFYLSGIMHDNAKNLPTSSTDVTVATTFATSIWITNTLISIVLNLPYLLHSNYTQKIDGTAIRIYIKHFYYYFDFPFFIIIVYFFPLSFGCNQKCELCIFASSLERIHVHKSDRWFGHVHYGVGLGCSGQSTVESLM